MEERRRGSRYEDKQPSRRRNEDPYRSRRGSEEQYRTRRVSEEPYRSRRGSEDPYRRPGRRRKKRRSAGKFILELILIALLAVGVFAVYKIGSIGHTKLSDVLRNVGIELPSGFTNIALYGVDSRSGELTKDCHSDMIIVLSLNNRTKEIKLASVYRDTYLDNTNGEYRKATECYFYGGPERSVNMLNKNLDLDIRDYVAVNFNAVVKAIDLLGGIDLEITDEEMNLINGYCVENELVTGASYTPLYQSGLVHLSGTQALAYTRIRYTEGWDYKRTERQRTVLMLLFQKARQQGVPALLSIANTMLPEISTSMNTVELLGLVSGIGSYSMGEQTGFPFEKTTANLAAGDCVVPVNLVSNVSALHEFLFGQYGYTPSQTVAEISSQISADTGIY